MSWTDENNCSSFQVIKILASGNSEVEMRNTDHYFLNLCLMISETIGLEDTDLETDGLIGP